MVHCGKTGADGLIEHRVPIDAERGDLTVWPDGASEADEYRWPLRIGHLNPESDVKGKQARLKNLGFYGGKIDGALGDKSNAALAAFEEKHGPADEGREEGGCTEKLLDVHGT